MKHRSSRRRTFICFLTSLCACTVPLFSQTYSYQQSQGAHPYANIRPDGMLVMKGPAEDTLTAWQPLPFEWSLFGKRVTGYRASDNGYITFDSTATASVRANIATASPAAPNNAIYAYWDDFHLSGGMPQWSNEIRSMTLGTAPNRTHVIMWVGIAPAGQQGSSNNTLSFLIALFEGGDFAVIFVAGRSSVPLTGSIGAENADGSKALFVDGTPTYRYPSVSADPNDDVMFRFTYSSVETDLAISHLSLPAIAKAGASLPITGTVKNLGSNVVTGFVLHYQFENEPTETASFNSVNIPSNGTFDFIHTKPWSVRQAGNKYPVTVWISDVASASADGNTRNDTARAEIFSIIGVSGAKHPLVEEFTGAWCGWCPDGGLQLQQIEALYPQAVLVSIHAGGLDSMITVAGAEIATAFSPAYPQAMIDRALFSGELSVPIGRSNNAWQNRTGQRLSAATPVDLSIAKNYEPSTRTVDATVAASYIDYALDGDYRLNVFVVEDRVVGHGKGFDQTNYYSKNSSYPNHPYYSETNPILNFVHRHVLRASLTGTWGMQGVIPSTPEAGKTYSRSFSYTIPTWMNPQEVSLVAFVSRYDAEITKREIINASEARVAPKSSVASGASPSRETLYPLSPNPARSSAILRFSIPRRQHVKVEVFDQLGRRAALLYDGEAIDEVFLPFDVASLPPGNYLVRMQTREAQQLRPLTIIK